MVDGRRRQRASLLLVPAAVVAASLAGCTSSSSSHGASAALSSTKGAKANSFSASKLRATLVPLVNGVGPASAAASGDYTVIAVNGPGEQAAKGAPKACEQATETVLVLA